MKKDMTKILAISAGILMMAIGVSAGENPVDSSKSNGLPKNQTVCPVMGGKIDSTEYTDIQGQRVYHCCGGCQKKLVANPDKYFKKAAEQGVIFENIQKRCPVSGKPLTTREFFTDLDGRRIYFAEKDGPAKFAADPAKYLKILDKQTKEDFPEKPAKKDSHEGHGH